MKTSNTAWFLPKRTAQNLTARVSSLRLQAIAAARCLACLIPRSIPASSLTADGTISTVDYFMIDQDQGFIIETDALNSFQVSLGYFAERCDVTLANNCQQSEQNAHGKHDLKRHGVSGRGGPRR
jgi:hypothetical protein